MTLSREEEFNISDFIPTQRQLLAKTKLHMYVPPNVIGGLMPSNISKLRGYLYPITIPEIEEWALSTSIFWFWFTLPNEQVLRLHAMRGEATDRIGEILRGEVADAKMAATQLKAAQLILNLNDKPSPMVTRNTMNIQGGPSDIPKNLQKKSTIELQEELKKLREANNDFDS